MVQVKTYKIPPTPLMPNSHHVLIHYPGLLRERVTAPNFTPGDMYDIFAKNGWHPQWIARYGPTQESHYHSTAHECMSVVSGKGATIRFGVADTPAEGEDHAHTPRHEDGGIYIEAKLGDVFVLPAGLAHKTHAPKPDAKEMKFMTPGERSNAPVLEPGVAKEYFDGIEMTGEFMMMGAYPGGAVWDYAVGGEHMGKFGQIWSIPKPERDPVLGLSPEGLCGLWKDDNDDDDGTEPAKL